MKLLEALANYECNYELILQILSYYNVIAENLKTNKQIYLKIYVYNNINTHKHSNFMHTLNLFSQMLKLRAISKSIQITHTIIR